jgi:hypothetical protein
MKKKALNQTERWRVYEQQKKGLQGKHLSPEEYEKKVRKIANRWKI